MNFHKEYYKIFHTTKFFKYCQRTKRLI